MSIRRLLLAVALVLCGGSSPLLAATTPFSPIAQFVVARSAGSAASVTTSAVTTTNGNSFIVVVGAEVASRIGSTPITDSKGNTYSSANLSAGGAQPGVATFYVRAGTGGASHTFTFTPSSSDFIWIVAIEVLDMASSPVNGTNKATATSTSHSSGNITSTTTEMWVGAGTLDASTELGAVWASPFLAVSSANATASTEGNVVAVRFVDSGVTAGFTYTSATSQNREVNVTAFKMTPTTSTAESAYTFVR